jgi:hypothetical protein
MRELLVGEPRDGSEPVLSMPAPGPEVETVRWGFEGEPAHLAAVPAPGVSKVYFSNGPPPVEPPARPRPEAAPEPQVDDKPMLLLLLCE